MRRPPSLLVLLMAVTGLLLRFPAAGSPAEKRPSTRNTDSPLQVALHYDFFGVEQSRVGDQAKPKHEGTIQSGEIVLGKRKPAVKFDGRGSIAVAASPDDLNPAQRTFSVGALCQPTALDGVLVAMGSQRNGFSIYLKAGVPYFAVRSAGELTKVAGDKPVAVNQWLHLLGTLDSNGQLCLIVNGWPAATAAGKLIAETPEQPLSIGADLAGTVGDYEQLANWCGLLEDIRLYWGVMDRNAHRDELGDWADLPGCGCK
ncbi:MAG: LamG-like jellyroll fold domain-containing protein [Pirellulaceae bacterium]